MASTIFVLFILPAVIIGTSIVIYFISKKQRN
jgi:hypothetical protein